MQPPKEKYEDTFIKPLVRAGEFPQQFDLSTSVEALLLTAMQANGAQLAAPTSGPSTAEDMDLSLRAHESLVGNFSEVILGGYRLTDERLAETWEKITGNVPEELQISEEKDPWTITFARRQPVAAVFGDGTARFAVRGRAFSRGDTVLRDPIEISASYSLERTPTGTKLTRQGEVAVDFLRSGGRLNVRQITFKTFLRRKFSAIFKESIVRDGLQLGGNLEKRGKLQLARLESGNGWIALGWNLPPEEQGAE